MNLTQQLEDKKKGCGCITAGNEEFGTMNCGDIWGRWEEDKWIDDEEPTYCDKCQAEIAILEQAIAEKNEFVELLKKEIRKGIKGAEFVISIIDRLKNIQSQQLNDVKETIDGSSPSQCGSLVSSFSSADISNLLQKQRQEILEDIEEILNEFVNDSDIDGRKICFEFYDTDLFELRDKLSKLNQPKTALASVSSEEQKQ